ncbi:hypothetical protein [Azorhizobium oxalatiphilum]|uniref:hypothetical protein n=1 Tax=Azorhizobium oxalatiphilum TaxID=980631 RepID=UPI001663F4FF|nr:hypothetical protein [Azorhizobium oxalatiphilum]
MTKFAFCLFFVLSVTPAFSQGITETQYRELLNLMMKSEPKMDTFNWWQTSCKYIEARENDKLKTAQQNHGSYITHSVVFKCAEFFDRVRKANGS